MLVTLMIWAYANGITSSRRIEHLCQQDVAFGRRPYDPRHAAVSLWLNSGVPATAVAHRGGHGAVLLKIYAHCIDGQATAANQHIPDPLSTQDAQQDPEEEVGGDPSRPPEMSEVGGRAERSV